MTIPGAEYWAQRSAARMDKYLRDSDDTLAIIGRAHQRAEQDIQDALDRIKAKMGRAYDLVPDEVQKLLAQPAGREEYERLLGEIATIKDPAARKALEARASSGAYAYRVNRLEALKDHVRAQTARLADEELGATRWALTRTITDAYSRSMFDLQRGTGFGFSFARMDIRTVNEILSNPWSGQTFSSRIWQSQEALANMLNERLTAGFMSGRSNAQLSRELADAMGVSYRNAERLVRTETNYMANAGEMASYKEADIDQYEFMATLDNRTSAICQELDGQVFDCDKARSGKNMPPMHPHCRSTTVAYFEDEGVEGLQRRAKDPITGEDVMVPRDMKYKDWLKLQEDTYGPERIALAKKMQANAANDRAQFDRYKALMGKTPFTGDFKTFQQMKYTDAEAYSFMQLDYSRRARLAADLSLAIPNAHGATAADEKFTGYLFNKGNADGWAKGVAFESRLGYNVDNWKQLQDEILDAARRYPSRLRGSDEHGSSYEQKVILRGHKGRSANVILGWKTKGNSTWLTTAYIKEVSPDGED